MEPGINTGKLKEVSKKGNLLKIKVEAEIEIDERRLKMQFALVNQRIRELQLSKERILEIAKQAKIEIE